MRIIEKYEIETSFSHWLVPDYPFNFILDISNFIILIILLFFVSKKLQLNLNLYLIFVLMMFTPFLFNGFLVDWTEFPDQGKYISVARDIRSSLLQPQNLIDYFQNNETPKVNFSAAIYNLFPSTNFETYKSIGFLNRFLLILIIAFFISKKTLPTSIKIFLILSPSLTLYSSISLREILVLFIMIFLTYNIIIKNKSYTSILAILLFLIKPQNLLIVIIPFLLQKLFTTEQIKKNNLFIILLLTISLILIFNYEKIFSVINTVSYGFFSETYGGYRGAFIEDHFSKFTPSNILFKFGLGISKILISPYPNITSVLLIVVFFENLIIYALIYFYLFKESFKKNFEQKIKLIWISTLLFSLSIYSIVSFNDGTIHRYKLLILVYILIGYNLHRSSYKTNI